MSLRTLAWIFGGVFIIIGFLGFVPAMAPAGKLFGIFMVDELHNIIHFISGFVFLVVGLISLRESTTRFIFQIFGALYGLITIVGMLAGSTPILGLLSLNFADNVLHLLIAALALAVGFLHKGDPLMGGGKVNTPVAGGPSSNI